MELFLDVLKTSKHAKYHAFLTLAYLMHGLNWRCLYIPKYPKLKNLLDILDRRLKIDVPALHASLLPHKASWEAFLRRFLRSFGMVGQASNKRELIDMFFIDGEVTLQRLLLNIVKVHKEAI